MPETLMLAETLFTWVGRIDPDRDASGAPIELMPQSRYAKTEVTSLNPSGAGPFCRFTIRNLPRSSGVYALTIDRDLVYLGKGQNLAQRWGPQGYASISPKNCFIGGQSTNCKVNNRILGAAQSQQIVELWIHETDDHGTLEGRLIRSLNPPWNNQTPRPTGPDSSPDILL